MILYLFIYNGVQRYEFILKIGAETHFGVKRFVGARGNPYFCNNKKKLKHEKRNLAKTVSIPRPPLCADDVAA